MSLDLPYRGSVQAVEGLLKVHKDHIKGSIPLMRLLKDLHQSEDVVDARFALPKVCLFLA